MGAADTQRGNRTFDAPHSTPKKRNGNTRIFRGPILQERATGTSTYFKVDLDLVWKLCNVISAT